MGWILAILSSFLPSTLPAFAEQVTLRLSPGDSIAQGHHVFMRTEGQAYDYARWIYQGAHSTVTIDNLQPGTVYYFVARAYSGNVVSIDSNEVAFMIPDADADGISDAKEIDQYGTDPHNPDSDGDGMTDGQELEFWGGEWSADGDHDGIINLLDTNASYADIRAQDSITQVPVPEATPSPVGKIYQWIEAEDADVYHPMQIENGDAQCSGNYVQIAEEAKNYYGWPGSPIGAVAYHFQVSKSGRYVIWGRVLAQHPYGRSFWVSVDGGPYALWDLSPSTQFQWGWDSVRDRDGAGEMVYDLSVGGHTLVVRNDKRSPKLDQLLITNDTNFLPRGMGALDSGPIKIWFEAEDADIYPPMQIENGDAQCSGEYVQIAAGMDNFYGWPGSPFGAIAYDFDIPASGRYVIWGRVLAQSQKGSSFWVSVDDKPHVLWDLERSNQWMWHPVSDHPRPGKMVYELSAGSHSLMIQQHQSSPKIDQLFITNAAHFLD